MNHIIEPSSDSLLDYMARRLNEAESRRRDFERLKSLRNVSLRAINEASLTGSDNVGADVNASSREPERSDDSDGDDGGGDPDPDPERSQKGRSPFRKPSPAGQSVQRCAQVPSALINFPSLPDDALVRLPVVTGLFACSPATVWRRVKSKALPAPRKLSERITAWRVGDLRAALASLTE